MTWAVWSRHRGGIEGWAQGVGVSGLLTLTPSGFYTWVCHTSDGGLRGPMAPRSSLERGFCDQKSLGSLTQFTLLMEVHHSYCSMKIYQKNAAVNKPT